MVKANHALSNSALKYENLHANYPVCNFFLNPAAEIMFNTLFKIILKTKPGNTERRRRKKEQRRDLHDHIRGGSHVQFLTPPHRD